ncbi:hypothetical protein F4776DRAFT_661605 [Hypoxylon sp. NC0597]|nr:hypothetical protein F4776DRAFT_661605 [Hypoxylon sp. NC0597]
MADPDLPTFKIQTPEDAEKIQETIEKLQDYVDGIELGVVLPPEKKDMLLKALNWIASASMELRDAMLRLSDDSKTCDLLRSMKDLLYTISRDTTWILEQNNKMKDNKEDDVEEK